MTPVFYPDTDVIRDNTKNRSPENAKQALAGMGFEVAP